MKQGCCARQALELMKVKQSIWSVLACFLHGTKVQDGTLLFRR